MSIWLTTAHISLVGLYGCISIVTRDSISAHAFNAYFNLLPYLLFFDLMFTQSGTFASLSTCDLQWTWLNVSVSWGHEVISSHRLQAVTTTSQPNANSFRVA